MVRNAKDHSRVDLCVNWVLSRIESDVLRPGMRLPSVRRMALERGVSPFTVVEAYGRLVGEGHVEARRRSGFYVLPCAVRQRVLPSPPATVDVSWLLHHMLRGPDARGPGVGVLPSSWLDAAQIAAAMRTLGREGARRWLRPGEGRGFVPLREVLQRRLAALDIIAGVDQIVLTTGVTHSLDLALRALVPPGDTILCLDPSWFGALGVAAANGVHVVGVPMLPGGPDLQLLERVAREIRPRLLVLGAAAQNPTGLSFAPGMAGAVIDIARRYDFHVFEDDVYADLCTVPVRRLAAHGGLDRVLHASSFSKTLASNVRVGFLACAPQLAERIVNAKVLGGFTTPEINERLVHKLLVEGRFADHVKGLRKRLFEHRESMRERLSTLDVPIFGVDHDGLFFWVDMSCDTTRLAGDCAERGLLVAPGALFSPRQEQSRWMRLNVTTPVDEVLEVVHASCDPRAAAGYHIVNAQKRVPDPRTH